MSNQSPLNLEIQRGTCFVMFAYDVGWSIDLNKADQHIREVKERSRMKRQRRAPNYFDYHPAPLRLTQEGPPLVLGEFSTHQNVEVVLFDFGAVSVTYRISLEGRFEGLLDLSEVLYENKVLQDESQKRVDQVMKTIAGAVERPKVSDYLEDYTLFHVEKWNPALPAEEIGKTFEGTISQILRCERQPLSSQEVHEANLCHVSYGLDDATIIDWNAALVFGQDMEDVRAVLEFGNVELLEMRYLDQQLLALSKPTRSFLPWPGLFHKHQGKIAHLQVDSAIHFERVTNTLKLLGDQYLARVYRMASQRFHLESWDASILRKLETLDSIYNKLSDRASNMRLEVLEWIIIILIAVSIGISFLPGMSGH
jgi:hypothetical protein